MAYYAMGDLHFSGIPPTKPMDVFHAQWINHRERILMNWQETVQETDTVFLVGDISWAIKLEEAKVDLDAICAMPGRKIMIRGNHDYWWTSKTKMRQATADQITFLQAECLDLGDVMVGGSRGYLCPGDALYKAHKDASIYQRELCRLTMAFEPMRDFTGTRIALLHYPPFNDRKEASGFTELLEEYKIDHCIFGHLHTFETYGPIPTHWGKTQLHLVSSNYLDFAMQRIML